MEIKFVHTNLIAKNWQSLARFYVDVFGCKPKLPERDLAGDWLDRLTGLNAAHLVGGHLLLPGFGEHGPTLEIFEYNQTIADEHKAVNKEGFGHIAFAVDDVDACLDRLLACGGSMVGEPVNAWVAGVGKLHVVYATDPEGNIVEIQKWE